MKDASESWNESHLSHCLSAACVFMEVCMQKGVSVFVYVYAYVRNVWFCNLGDPGSIV